MDNFVGNLLVVQDGQCENCDIEWLATFIADEIRMKSIAYIKIPQEFYSLPRRKHKVDRCGLSEVRIGLECRISPDD